MNASDLIQHCPKTLAGRWPSTYGIMLARSYRRLNRYSNSARYLGTCLLLIARYVPVIADLMLPRAVLTHLKVVFRAEAGPLPVRIA